MPNLTAAGVTFHPWRIDRRSLNPLAGLASTRRLAKIYQDLKPDLVHHYTVKSVVCGTVAARKAGVRSIVNAVTGLPYIVVSPKKRLSKKVARWIAMRVYAWSVRGEDVHVVVQNRDDLDMLESIAGSLNGSTTMTRGSGVDLGRFQFRTDDRKTNAEYRLCRSRPS